MGLLRELISCGFFIPTIMVKMKCFLCFCLLWGTCNPHNIGTIGKKILNTTTECMYVIIGMIVTKSWWLPNQWFGLDSYNLSFHLKILVIWLISMWRPDKGHTNELNLYGARTLTSFTFATNYFLTTWPIKYDRCLM